MSETLQIANEWNASADPKTAVLSPELTAQRKAEAAGLAYVSLADYEIDPSALELVPEAVARKHTVLPLYRLGQTLVVAMENPWNALAIDEIRLATTLTFIKVVLSSPDALRRAINRHYGHKILEEAAQLSTNGNGTHGNVTPGPLEVSRPHGQSTRSTFSNGFRHGAHAVPNGNGAQEVQIAHLLDALLAEAREARASDIHLEPEEHRVRVRYRIDGLLQEIRSLPLAVHDALTLRLKLLAKLDITEHRLPQDGSLSMTVDGHPADLRLSTYPTVFGENVVVRLLDPAQLRLGLDQLGFSPDTLQQFIDLIHRPYGMILVTGPTGSGKTTTLYSALTHLNSVTTSIVTIEDPVEYRLPSIRQTQVNPKAGVTFAIGLRSLLRQDPNVIMIGEIRDKETAEIAVHAALTGHLVLSTMHTNDAVGAVTRLIDLGIAPYLVASTLLGVVAQRLVRCLCPHCTIAVPAPEELQGRIPGLAQLSHSTGCRMCRQTGFLGRIGAFELFGLEEQIKAWIAAARPLDELKRLAISAGMRLMRADGLLKVARGHTSLEELDRAIPGEGHA